MKVLFAEAAETDIEEIGSWLLENAEDAALAVVQGLRRGCRALGDMPARFRLFRATRPAEFDGASTAAT